MTTNKPEIKACAMCKYFKKGLFGKNYCSLQKIKTKAEQLCYGYEKKKK